MKKGTDMIKVDTRVNRETYDSIVKLARDKYDGNFSMALRMIIKRGQNTTDLTSFGNYLLSDRRKELINSPELDPERIIQVSDADIANWKDSCSQQPTPGK